MSMGWVELLNWVALVAHIEVGYPFSYVWSWKVRKYKENKIQNKNRKKEKIEKN